MRPLIKTLGVKSPEKKIATPPTSRSNVSPSDTLTSTSGDPARRPGVSSENSCEGRDRKRGEAVE